MSVLLPLILDHPANEVAVATVRHPGSRCGACEVRGDLTWTPPRSVRIEFQPNCVRRFLVYSPKWLDSPLRAILVAPVPGRPSVLWKDPAQRDTLLSVPPRQVTGQCACARAVSADSTSLRSWCPAGTSPDGTSPKHEETAAPSSLMHGLELSRSC